MFPIYDFHHQFQGPKQTSQVTNYIPDIPEIIHNELFRIILNYSKLFLGSWWGSLQCSAQFSQKSWVRLQTFRTKPQLPSCCWSTSHQRPRERLPASKKQVLVGNTERLRVVLVRSLCLFIIANSVCARLTTRNINSSWPNNYQTWKLKRNTNIYIYI